MSDSPFFFSTSLESEQKLGQASCRFSLMQLPDLVNHPDLGILAPCPCVCAKIKIAGSRICLVSLLEVKINQLINQTEGLDKQRNKQRNPNHLEGLHSAQLSVLLAMERITVWLGALPPAGWESGRTDAPSLSLRRSQTSLFLFSFCFVVVTTNLLEHRLLYFLSFSPSHFLRNRLIWCWRNEKSWQEREK